MSRRAYQLCKSEAMRMHSRTTGFVTAMGAKHRRVFVTASMVRERQRRGAEKHIGLNLPLDKGAKN